MEKLEKKITGYLAMASGMTIAMVVLGLIFTFLPNFSREVIHILVTATLLASGLYMLVCYGSFSGVVTLVMGLIVAANPGIWNIIPIILGVYIIFSSFFRLRSALKLRATARTSFLAASIMSAIGLICGVVMITSASQAGELIMRIIGVTMIVYGLSDFADVMILRRHLEAFSKDFKKAAGRSGSNSANRSKGTRISDIAEGEVVKKK